MSEIKLTKPKSTGNKNIEMDLKNFVLSFLKLLISKGGDGWTDVLGSLNLSNNSREEQTWILFFSALTSSLKELLDDYPELLLPNPTPRNNEVFVVNLIQKLETQEIILTSDFFNNPSSFLDDSAWESLITDWLKKIGFHKDEYINAFVSRLKSQFTLALHEEWSRRAEQYTAIAEYLNSPFLPAAKRERELARYRAFLQKQVDERVFNETFGLREIYIRLRAYYNKYGQEIEKYVVDLHTEINNWINNPISNNQLCIICGGPGSGKSSFAKMLAAEQASKNHLPVLFVPLHRFKLNDYLLESISSFVKNHPYLQGANPIENQKNNAILLIFDGLDELSMRGESAEQIAADFIIQVQDVLSQDGLHWKAIITGREVAIQIHNALFNEPKMLWLLPYFLDEDEKKVYTDPNHLLAIDQRDEWWKKFGKLKNLPYNLGLPQELATEYLQPITREPLLNYLVALTFQAQRIQFDKNTNLNQVYADLLKSVYERQYEQARIHRSIQPLKLEKEDFERILEEIALTVWHGNGRTASISTISKQCEDANLDKLFQSFQDSAKQDGVMRLMIAFYFREFGRNEVGEKTFEFTHKSFGEYLTARRIVARLNNIFEEVIQNKKTLEEAFVEWLKLCGAEAIDKHLYDFIAGEIQLMSQVKSRETLLKHQKLLFNLLTMAVKEQSPVRKLGLETFRDDLKYCIYAESALLIMHSLYSMHTKTIIRQEDEQFFTLFKKWLQRNKHGTLLTNAFQYLYLSKIWLNDENLIGINFNGTNLREANLCGANLKGANLNETYLEAINLSSADLSGVNLNKADLRMANLFKANLIDAKLTDANLYRANLCKANLHGADLCGAYLYVVNFCMANLYGADLYLANLYKADLKGANLSKANLYKADLREADLSQADLREADLREADLREADLREADLREADLSQAYLKRTDLRKADLTNTKLPNDILDVAILSDEQREEIQQRFNQNARS